MGNWVSSANMCTRWPWTGSVPWTLCLRVSLWYHLKQLRPHFSVYVGQEDAWRATQTIECRFPERELFTVLPSFKLQEGGLTLFLYVLFLSHTISSDILFLSQLPFNIRGVLMPPAAGCLLVAARTTHFLVVCLSLFLKKIHILFF